MQATTRPEQVLVQQLAAPRTPAEYRAMMDRRDELTSQLTQAEVRRSQLLHEVQRAVVNEAGPLQSQMRVVDARIERLQSEIDRTNDLIINTSPDVLAAMRAENRTSTQPAFPGNARLPREVIPLAGMFSVFFVFPIAIALARLIWKRASAPTQHALPDAASAQRLDQLQQSVDAIAVEVERISEGQRYVAKLYAEKERPSIGA